MASNIQYNETENLRKYIPKVHTCSRCFQRKTANFFISKKGKEIRKVCSHCREQISDNNKKRKFLKQNDNLLTIELDELKKIITDKIRVNDHNCFYENENSGLEAKCILSTIDLEENNKEIVNNIVKIIMEKDGYSYVHNNQHSWVRSESTTTFKFYYSQSVNLSKKPHKNLDIKKQRDREQIERFSCNGYIKIVIDNTQILLEQDQFNKLLLNITSEIQYLGFITPFFDQLKNNKEVVVDVTYKTNALEFELYAAIGQIDGCGYPIAYLFLNNAKKSDGIRTAILTEFFQSLKQNGLINLRFFLTDKDWAQISAARQV
ncbi:unnamed protein product [Rhizophagus irregularis]|nr:unnamed protein product [Rhizophagus irregularis]